MNLKRTGGSVRASEATKLNGVELFLLALVHHGMTAPYDFVRYAGMSVGVTSPGLKRLEKVGLLESVIGSRKRTDYKLTDRGRQVLFKALENRTGYLDTRGSSTFEVLPRHVLLLCLGAAGPLHRDDIDDLIEIAIYALSEEVRRKKRDAEMLLAEVQALDASGQAEHLGKLMAVTYRWLKAEMDSRLLDREIDIVSQLSSVLRKLPISLQI